MPYPLGHFMPAKPDDDKGAAVGANRLRLRGGDGREAMLL